MVYNQATGIIIILDNGTTAMTGHQNHPATGITLQNKKAAPISITGLCKALGIERVYEVDAYDKIALEDILKESQMVQQITVIVAKGTCVLKKKRAVI